MSTTLSTKRTALGQLMVCTGCCCGRTDKGKPPVPVDWLKQSWKEAKLKPSIQLTITGCLGPCDLVNVVCILTPQDQIWLGGISEQNQYESLLAWAKSSAEAGSIVDLPLELQQHQFKRF
jgi:predicted metal-binding protein